MKIDLRTSSAEDNEAIRALLMETKLPTESIGNGATSFYIAEDDGRLLGIAGLEFYGDDALLRSVAVRPGLQRQGIGSAIVDRMLDEARKKEIRRVILLTETAREFFLRKGFDVVERSAIDNEAMKKSSEFAYACPASAVCMVMEMKPERSGQYRGAVMKTDEELKSEVKNRYASIVETPRASCGCGGKAEVTFEIDYSGVDGYNPDADYGLGCGIPTDGAGIKPGDTVLDLGSGAGNDAFVARRLVGETGRVIGIDMTEAMIEKAKVNNAKVGYSNVEFRLGEIEDMPVESNSIDVVLSNCVLNLVPDKRRAFAEIMRVLKPGGHFSISDIVTSRGLPEKLREVAALYAGCVSGALVKEDYLAIIARAGFAGVDVKSERPITIPDDILAEIDPTDIKALRSSDAAILSITVRGTKPRKV
jgi:arsenite methyltransferase